MVKANLLLLSLTLLLAVVHAKLYTPDWPSLNSRPNPQWWNESKFTLFMHWGLYSTPSYCGPVVTDTKTCYAEWYWFYTNNNGSNQQEFHDRTYGENFKYQDFTQYFKAELFNSTEWANLFKASGAKALVMTSKHHEGYTMWPSSESWNWNAVDTGPGYDVLGNLTDAVRAAGLRMGYYYSLYEWYNPLYRSADPSMYVDQVMIPQLHDLVNTYHPDVLYVDGEWEHESTFWQTRPFLAWLFNDSPVKDTVAINDRWGNETRGHDGGFFVCEYNAFSGCPLNKDFSHPWTAHEGMGSSFGYNRIDNYKPVSYFITLLVHSVAYGGHLQLNVGPTGDGRVPDAQKDILLEMGQWLSVNGEAIYNTTYAPTPQDPKTNTTYYLKTMYYSDTYYVITIGWPGEKLTLSALPPSSVPIKITMIGVGEVSYVQNGPYIVISVPQLTIDQLPCEHAWAFKISGQWK